MNNPQTIIQFDPESNGSFIKFDIPLPSHFDGKNIVNVKVPIKDWNDFISESASNDEIYKDISNFTDKLKQNVDIETKHPIPAKEDKNNTNNPGLLKKMSSNTEIIIPNELHDSFPNVPIIHGMKKIKPYQLKQFKPPEGSQFKITKSLTGNYLLSMDDYVQAQVQIFPPQLAIVEKYRLEVYLGNFGMGKTISSFYVHPNSKIHLSIKSWKTSSQSYEDASSIFDSLTDTASESFQSTLSIEQSKSKETQEQSAYYADVSADAGFFGICNVEAKAGTSGSSSAARKEFSKDIKNTARTHASEKSACREMQHNVTSVSNQEEGEEQVLTREIENLNAGHVLNFIIRELNQEYHTALVLKDVRIQFMFSGYGYTIYDEVPIYKIDEFLNKYIIADKVKHYREYILGELSQVRDYKGTKDSIIDILRFDDGDMNNNMADRIKAYDAEKHYISVDNKLRGIGKNIGGKDGNEIKVEGIPIEVDTVTMKTDGVICSSLLDLNPALDNYATEMQAEALNKNKLENKLLQTSVDKFKVANDLVINGTTEQIDNFLRLYDVLLKEHKEEDE